MGQDIANLKKSLDSYNASMIHLEFKVDIFQDDIDWLRTKLKKILQIDDVSKEIT